MFENIAKFFKKLMKSEVKEVPSKETAKERLHLVLMQDRANVSADFLELMKQEIIEVIKKYIEIEESAIDVRLTNESREDGTQGAPSLYANIPILKIKNEMKNVVKNKDAEDSQKDNAEEQKEENNDNENVSEKEESVEEKESEQPNNDSNEVESDKDEITENKEDVEEIEVDGIEEEKIEENNKVTTDTKASS